MHGFKRWPELLARCGLIAPDQDTITKQTKRRSLRGINVSQGGESKQHKDLKNWIAANGKKLPFGVQCKGEVEYLFPSGDRGDVFFRKNWTIIEVKATGVSEAEIERGIWQARKYQLLLDEVMRFQGCIPTAKAFLAIEEVMPKRLSMLCRKLDVTFFDRIRHRAKSAAAKVPL